MNTKCLLSLSADQHEYNTMTARNTWITVSKIKYQILFSVLLLCNRYFLFLELSKALKSDKTTIIVFIKAS